MADARRMAMSRFGKGLTVAAILSMSTVVLTSGTAAAQITAPTLKDLQDRSMIDDLMARYEWALDTLDADAYSSLFTEDGALVRGGTHETKGRAAIAQEVREIVARYQGAQKPAAEGAAVRAPKAIHSYSNVIIELQGDRATAKSNWVQIWNVRDGLPEISGAGEYHDHLVKLKGKWYFQRREIVGTMSVPQYK